MKKINSKKLEHLFYTILIILFIFLVSIVCLKHEYWADETNAWLIANDLSIVQLFARLHADGHPALFHLIIKLFTAFGLQIKDFHIISILFSTLGITYLLFKSNYKWYIKALLPFTFFIFYQYTAVTRGYCLILLLLSIIADIWDKKKDKCILFTILIILLLSLEAYTFMLAGSMYLIYIIEYINDYKKDKKHNKKQLICIIIIFFAFLITTIYVMPRATNTFNPNIAEYFISDSFITPFNASKTIKLLGGLLILSLYCYLLIKNDKKIKESVILLLPLFLFMAHKYCNLWHTGVMFLAFIFIGWIHNYSKHKIFNISMIIICSVQIYWSVNNSIYDYKESYSPSKEVADFIKTYDYKNMKIYGANFYESAVTVYFEENIFDNWDNDVRYFYWDISNKYYTRKYDIDALLEYDVDMLVITPLYDRVDREKIKEYYDEYKFEGTTYFQVSKFEDMTQYVYVKKK